MQIKTSESHRKLNLICQVGKALNKWKKATRQSRQRYLILKELVESQGQYLLYLSIITKQIQKPLLECKAINEEEANSMFSIIQNICKCSSEMYKDLKILLYGSVENQKNAKDEKGHGWNKDTTLIAPTMLQYYHYFKFYSEFFKEYQKNLDKLKLLSENNFQAKDIERKLKIMINGNEHIQNFASLYSKPMQRSMKYHLILERYQHNTSKDHPDYEKLGQAIKGYREVNQKNNQKKQGYEKNAVLLELQSKLGGIIKGHADRHLIGKGIVDNNIQWYLLSDLLILLRNQVNQKQSRIQLDYRSSAIPVKDSIFFKNQVYLCGQSQCIYLSFDNKYDEIKFLNFFNKNAQQLYNNKINRYQKQRQSKKNMESQWKRQVSLQNKLQNILSNAEPYLSSPIRKKSIEIQNKSRSTRPSTFSDRHLNETLSRPPKLVVIGQVKRQFSPKVIKSYFVIKFELPEPIDRYQQLYIQLDDLLSLQKLMRSLYPNQLLFTPLIQQYSNQLKLVQSKQNSTKTLEFVFRYSTIFLNTLFIHPSITIQTDIILHKLGIIQGLRIYWINEGTCKCRSRKSSESFNLQKYEQMLWLRQTNKRDDKTYYCPICTINAQKQVIISDPSSLTSAIDRLFWIRCQRGLIDYRLISNESEEISIKPKTKDITIYMDRVQQGNDFYLTINIKERVGQVLGRLQTWMKTSLIDYELCLQINKNCSILDRNQILCKELQKQQRGDEGLLSSIFRTKIDNTIRIILKKIWVLQPHFQKANLQKQDRTRFVIEQFMSRVKREEILLNMNDTNTLYAANYCYHNRNRSGQTISQLQLSFLLDIKKWSKMSNSSKKSLLKEVQNKIVQLKSNHNQSNMVQYIREFIIKIGSNRPGWSAFLFDATLIKHPKYEEGMAVKLGADLNYFYVKENGKMINIFEQRLQNIIERLTISGCELSVKYESWQLVLSGNNLFQLQEIMDTYCEYKRQTQRKVGDF